MATTSAQHREGPQTVKVREVTDEEVGLFHQNGWAKLPGLIDRELAAEMLEVACAKVEHSRTTEKIWNTSWHFARQGIEPFRSVAYSEVMGRNAQRLINRRRLTDREIGIRAKGDLVVCKLRDATKHIYHHDGHGEQPDRGGTLTLWLALDEVTPEMGAMRFISGSHREGPLGLAYTGKSLLEDYPKLLDLYELSPPLHYQPGDATVHNSWTVHGSPPNTTDRPRWSYLVGYVAADVFLNAAELTALDDGNSTAIYPPSPAMKRG